MLLFHQHTMTIKYTCAYCTKYASMFWLSLETDKAKV